MTHPWTQLSREQRLQEVREALDDACGNITVAAERLGVARQYLTRIVKKHDLNEYAAKLRIEAGAARSVDERGRVTSTGRPRK